MIAWVSVLGDAAADSPADAGALAAVLAGGAAVPPPPPHAATMIAAKIVAALRWIVRCMVPPPPWIPVRYGPPRPRLPVGCPDDVSDIPPISRSCAFSRTRS